MSGQSKLQPQSQQQQQQQNHPSPELTDKCLLAIFSQMDVDDRISAQAVCPRWYHRVREAHSKTVRSLTIALGNKYLNNLASLENVLNWYSVASRSSVRLLTKVTYSVTGKEEPEFPLHCLSKWNCLNFDEGDLKSISKRIAQTVSFNGSITELTFYLAHPSYSLEHLIRMLEVKDGSWQMRLRKLTIVSRFFRQSHFWQELFKVINHMPSLRCLYIAGIDELPSEEVGFPVLNQLTDLHLALTTIKSAFIWLLF